MFQPCHRCDRARLAISVPSPRRSSFLSVGISPSPLVRSATVSLVLEFDWPPLISSSTASLDQWCIHLDRYMTPPSIFIRTSSGLGEFWCSQLIDSAVSCHHHDWFFPTLLDLDPASPWRYFSVHHQNASPSLETAVGWYPPCRNLCTGPPLGYKNRPRFLAFFSPSPTHILIFQHYQQPLPNLQPYLQSTFTMSSIYDGYDTNDFYCEGRSDPSIDIGVRYYPDRDQWSPVFNPNVVPDDSAVGNKGPIKAVGDKTPIEAVGDKTPIDVKPTVDAKDKGPAEATLPSELVCSASLVYIPKGMEIVETRTHYYPLKDKWHAINDPSRHYDCPHPFVCVPWSVHDPELPPGLPVPFLRTLNLPVPAPTTAPSTSSSESSSNDSDSSSTYPLISNYINLNHQGVQKLLLDDNTPPTAVCIYTEEDVMRIFEGIAPEYVDMCSEYPPSSLAEFDRRVMFFENMQWFFRNKRSTYLSTRKF
ncbi:hypothetical protein PGTUg99_023598 [Puccinia graminis f. sp. tritici]|uniref:Uncharacterized protein n=1 Tax=Puccinia graminis f. sp. tritici TaxID=56615 RepID=A0A5B0SK78_PUCGR|nr:hypothetical protein PGTUg99_023598 [Puccinia graminis f. sp. tritici]